MALSHRTAAFPERVHFHSTTSPDGIPNAPITDGGVSGAPRADMRLEHLPALPST
jgi:hypothetical protein